MGLEPTHLAAADFESAASTDSAIPARDAHYPRSGRNPASCGRPDPAPLDTMPLTLNDFDYTLPAELIAQSPLAERSASRLLIVTPNSGEAPVLADAVFTDLADLVQPGDLFRQAIGLLR